MDNCKSTCPVSLEPTPETVQIMERTACLVRTETTDMGRGEKSSPENELEGLEE